MTLLSSTKKQIFFNSIYSVFILILLCFSSTLFSQKANFYSNITEGCNSLNVKFTDASEGATSWEWDLGNGNISTLQNPLANYTRPGKYTVKLTINGNISVKKDAYIKVYNNPIPDFSSDITKGCVPLQVQFEDKTVAADGQLESWVWLIDGASISEKSPNYTFKEFGSYKITLMAIDEHGCYGNTSKSKFITVSKVPDVSFDIIGETPCELPYLPIIKNTTTIKGVDEPFIYINNWEWKVNNKVVSKQQKLDYSFEKNGNYTISLSAQMATCTDSVRVEDAVKLNLDKFDYSINREDGSSLTDSIIFKANNSNIRYIEWDLGDGYKTNKKQFKYCYADTGKYEVSITAILYNNCHLYKTRKLDVLPTPSADFTIEQQNVCKPPFIVKFTNTSKMANKVLWDFGDGQSSKSDTVVYHKYNSTGEFDVKLIAYDKGKTDTITKTLELFVPSGTPIFANQSKGCIPLNVQFSTATPIKNIHWNFGDGEESSLQSPQHTFTEEGTYNVEITYTNSQGCPVNSTVEINGGTKPIVKFAITQTDSCNRSPIKLINNSSNYQTEIWNIGDYSEFFYADEPGNYSYHFNSSGYKPVELILDNNGCKASLTKEKEVYIKPPVAYFYMNDPLCEVPAQSNINNHAEGYDDISWNFGDGHRQNSTPDHHVYENVGTYFAYQRVVNHSTGCSDYDSQPIHVSVTNPDFIVSGANTGCLPFSVSFEDKSTTTGKLYKWFWDFGDGTIDTTYTGEVSHKYTKPGAFDVKLTVQEFYGCRETVIKENAVMVNHSIAQIGYIKDTVCVNETFELNNLSTSNSSIVDQNWLFSTGETSTVPKIQHAFNFYGDQHAILKVTDKNGCVDSDTLNINVPISEAIFIVNGYACTKDVLDVQNISLGEELSYKWDFGDGGTSFEKEPEYIYKTDGTYDINLQISTKSGCSSSSTQSLKAITPVVDFDAYKTELGCARNALPAVFYNRSSEDIYMWEWDFGDGEESTSPHKNPQYLFTQPGYYDVKLIATSKGGCSREIIKEDYIHLTGPVGKIVTDISAGCVPLTVAYNIETDAKNKISWDVGDGTNHYDDQVNFNHTYNESRSFFPSIILTDEDGCTMQYDGNPIVVDSYPELSFKADNTEVCEGAHIEFEEKINLKSSKLSNISEIVWNFGDSETSTGSSPTHTYSASGSYDVELYVKTSIGCNATLKKEDFIKVFPSSLKADFSTSKPSACLGESISFNNKSTSDYAITQENWDFGDGESSVTSIVNHTFKEGGLFDTKLTVTDQQGCIDSTIAKIQINNIKADFIASPTSGYEPLNVDFTEQAVSDSKIVSWNWNFGDESTSDLRNPKHSFIGNKNQNSYNVSLTVTDDISCSATATSTVHAVNSPPIAVNDSISMQEDNDFYGNLSYNDLEPDNQQLVYNTVPHTSPNYGSISIQEDGAFIYTPNQNYFGKDELEYKVCDNGIPSKCSTAKVIVQVLSVEDLPPIAMPDKFEVNEKTSLTGSNILANDIDNEGLGLSVVYDDPISTAIHGNVVLKDDGTFTYSPNSSFIGKDSLKYIVSDNGIPAKRDTSWIIIDVLPVEEPPLAIADHFTTNEEMPVTLLNLADNDTDPENNIDLNSVKVITPVSYGSISNSDNKWEFTPEKDFYGTVLLSYSICDMTFLCDTAEIVIQVNQVNDPPIAVNDYYEGFEDVPLEMDILSNDIDADNNLDASKFKLLNAGISDNVKFDKNSGILTYYTKDDYIGSDVLTYEICDSTSLCSMAKIYIDLKQSFDDSPVTYPDTIWITQSLLDTVNVARNDTDPEHDLNIESVSIASSPESYPDITVLEGGRILVDYISNPTFIGNDSLTYQICDMQNHCSEGKLYIVVKPYKKTVFIPQAITPNGDGRNDLFCIKNIERFPTNRLYVYNRWEHEVYSKIGYENTWDGTANNKPLPDGTYYYLLYLFEGDEPIKGFVYISR